ncbi:MAG: endonuclease/exonuclease/phosphatase family protein [Phycisphaerales bacterium]|nr:endonuclease/exonuclease/phosphatase family protein [Phycisphaerales bacterium]
MRFLAWNILHGGGPARMPEIAHAIAAHRPDVVALSEVRRTTGGQIAGALADTGLSHWSWTDPPAGVNGVLIAARTPFDTLRFPPPASQRLLAARFAALDLNLIAAHVPPDPGSERAHAWKSLLDYAKSRQLERTLVLGDLNAGRDGDLHALKLDGQESLGKLWTWGFRDLFRKENTGQPEFSWLTPDRQGGGRIDHAIATGSLSAAASSVRYSHAERDLRISDHSILLVDFEWSAGRDHGTSSAPSPTIPGGGTLFSA